MASPNAWIWSRSSRSTTRPRDAWFVDIPVDPGAAAGPWVQLGLVRYQEHAMTSADNPRRDLRVSMPANVSFRLEPMRTLSITRKPRQVIDGVETWPIEVSVKGPLSVVSGGTNIPPPEAAAMAAVRRPRFKLSVIQDNQVIQRLTSDDPGQAPPTGETLWTTTIPLKLNPFWRHHYVFVEEVDMMLSAHGPSGADVLVESGPRFMAKLRVPTRG
jgi:hypothetical protein